MCFNGRGGDVGSGGEPPRRRAGVKLAKNAFPPLAEKKVQGGTVGSGGSGRVAGRRRRIELSTLRWDQSEKINVAKKNVFLLAHLDRL